MFINYRQVIQHHLINHFHLDRVCLSLSDGHPEHIIINVNLTAGAQKVEKLNRRMGSPDNDNIQHP